MSGLSKQIIAIGAAMRGRYNPDGSTEQQLEFNGEECSNAITTVGKDSLVLIIEEKGGKDYAKI